MSKAIATIVIGDVFKSMWFDGNLGDCANRYCGRHGYDLIVFDDYLDKSDFGLSRPPHWQKLLILESERLAAFDDVVWLDADILINHHRAPCIVSQKKTGKIGCVTLDSTEMITPAKRDNRWKRRNAAPVTQWYQHFGLGADVDQWTNTGVLALTKAHKDLLRFVYDTGQEKEGFHQENGPLSYHIFKNGLAEPLDPRFNFSWTAEVVEHYPFLFSDDYYNDYVVSSLCVNAAWHNSYFMHFLASKFRRDYQLVQVSNTRPDSLLVKASPDHPDQISFQIRPGIPEIYM
jgi:hypothetical protein